MKTRAKFYSYARAITIGSRYNLICDDIGYNLETVTKRIFAGRNPITREWYIVKLG